MIVYNKLITEFNERVEYISTNKMN